MEGRCPCDAQLHAVRRRTGPDPRQFAWTNARSVRECLCRCCRSGATGRARPHPDGGASAVMWIVISSPAGTAAGERSIDAWRGFGQWPLARGGAASGASANGGDERLEIAQAVGSRTSRTTSRFNVVVAVAQDIAEAHHPRPELSQQRPCRSSRLVRWSSEQLRDSSSARRGRRAGTMCDATSKAP